MFPLQAARTLEEYLSSSKSGRYFRKRTNTGSTIDFSAQGEDSDLETCETWEEVVGVQDCDTANEITRFKETTSELTPSIYITLLNHTFPALLDTGSSISLLGGQVVALIRNVNARTKASIRCITQARGFFSTDKAIDLKVEWKKGKSTHEFVLNSE